MNAPSRLALCLAAAWLFLARQRGLIAAVALAVPAIAATAVVMTTAGCERIELPLIGRPSTKMSPPAAKAPAAKPDVKAAAPAKPVPNPHLAVQTTAKPDVPALHAREAASVMPKVGGQGGRGVPTAALKHRAELVRVARSVDGMDAPVAVYAAQIHQESGWRENAKSPVGAQGMAQFMPATADWISKAFPELAVGDPYNPAWAMRALVTYDRYLRERIVAASDCHQMAFALSAYNGGLGWVQRDRKLAASQGLEPGQWWGQVEIVNAGRSAASHKENRGYPRRILNTLTPLYVADGWGAGVCP